MTRPIRLLETQSRRAGLVLIFLIGLAVTVLIWPHAIWQIRFLLLAPSPAEAPSVLQATQQENLWLKSQLTECRLIQGIGTGHLDKAIPAFVYSTYPFNLKNQLIVALAPGLTPQTLAQAAVLVFTSSSKGLSRETSGVLIGRVERLTARAAVVATIFDYRWKSAVKVGEHGVPASLDGGIQPKLTLIPKTARVVSGDAIINVAPDFPYGLPIASVTSIRPSADNLFQEAEIAVPYDPNTLQVVWLVPQTF